ncbi:hypothetical protein BDV10DRAFT_187379 [Aspergillus recurvatus]
MSGIGTAGKKKVHILDAFHDLTDSYWHGGTNNDTHEACMKDVGEALTDTTWNTYKNKPGAGLPALHGVPKKLQQLQDYFQIELVNHNVCQYCKKVEEKRDVRQLLLSTRYKNGTADLPEYRVSEAIGDVLEDDGQGTSGWTCGTCVK